MKKFILFDQSLVNLEGHHYEYANRIIKCVTENGYTTSIAAHKNCDTELLKLNKKIFPLYKYKFWGRPGKYQWLLKIVYYLLNNLIKKNLNNNYKFINFFLNKRINLKISSKTLKYIFYPATLINKTIIDLLGVYICDNFAKCTLSFLKKNGLAKENIFLFPTICLEEIYALRKLMQKFDENCKWFFIIRDIPKIQQLSQVLTAQKIIDYLKKINKNSNVKFFTDTEFLKNEFDQKFNLTFVTLPIPCDLNNAKHENKIDKILVNEKIKFSYLGTARIEKNFHLLADVIEKIRKEKKSKIEFNIQIAYSMLSSSNLFVEIHKIINMENDLLNIAQGTLDTEAYQKFIDATDVILLVYNREKYRIRSSGVFAEAIYNNKIVLTSSGTWMANSLSKETNKYHHTIRNSNSLIIQKKIHYEQQLNNTITKFEIEPPKYEKLHYLFIQITQRTKTLGKFVQIVIEYIKPNDSYSIKKIIKIIGGSPGLHSELMYIPNDSKIINIVFSLTNSDISDLNSLIEKFQLESWETDKTIPTSCIGIIVNDNDPEDIKDGIQEIVCHFKHYSMTNLKFGENIWRKQHCSQNLVNTMLNSLLISSSISR